MEKREMIMMSYYRPKPKRSQKRLPKRLPRRVVPSGIGDKDIVGNWLMYYVKGDDHLYDFSPYDNHGTIYGAKWIQGSIGWALDFDGSDDYVNVADSSSLDITDKITIVAWTKTTVSGSRMITVGKRSQDVGGYDLINYDDGYIYFRLVNGTGNNFQCSVPTPEDGNWHLYTATYDGSELELRRDYDAAVGTASVSITIGTNSLDLQIGKDPYSADQYYFDGSIDEVRIYDRALSAEEISLLYSRTNI